MRTRAARSRATLGEISSTEADMNVLVTPPRRQPQTVLEPPAALQPVEVPEAITADGHNRWFLVLGIPFVVGAAFFGLAIGLDEEWPMTPAFLFGPLVMIAAYVYLCLTSDSNTE
jgi:hypothetical protein